MTNSSGSSNSSDITDLANPQFSEAGHQRIQQLADIAIECSLDGMLNYAKTQLDVPLYKGGENDDYLERLEAFLLEAVEQGQLPDYGKNYLALSCAEVIINRSRMEYVFQRFPQINDEQIHSPIIIAGIPRSGTTNLSNIIAADSRLNSLPFWVGMHPFPAKSVLDQPDQVEDNRDQQWKEFLDGINAMCPHFPKMIDVPYDGATEETALMHLSGTPIGFMNQGYTPEWNTWFWEQMDPTYMYATFKRSLQAVQFFNKGSGKRWILKNPHHLAFLPALDKTFEDARYIITHRDPASSVISNAYMITYLHRLTHDKPSPANGLHVAHFMGKGMIGGLVRDIDKLKPEHVHQIYFQDYMADTLGQCEQAYKVAGLEWNDTARDELAAYIDSHPRGRHGGKLVYKVERDFGVTRQQLREPYQFYLDKFPRIQVEEKHG